MYGNVHNNVNPAQPSEKRGFAAFDAVVIAASAGGIGALTKFLGALPPHFAAPIVIAQHLPPLRTFESSLDRVLQRSSALRVKWAENGEMPVPGVVYVAPQGKVTHINRDGSFSSYPTWHVRGNTPSANLLFRSAAACFGRRVLALVLSGALSDGAEGCLHIARAGGTVLVQSQASSQFPDMPRAAFEKSRIGLAFDPLALARIATALVMVPGTADWFRVGEDRIFEYGVHYRN